MGFSEVLQGQKRVPCPPAMIRAKWLFFMLLNYHTRLSKTIPGAVRKNNLMQSELAVSFEWLGLDTESGRFVEIPSFRIGAGLMITKGEPRRKELLALPREQLEKLYPSVRWPSKSTPKDLIGGDLPDTIRVDETDFGRIWIDLKK